MPSSVVNCFNGDPLAALLRLGLADDPRVEQALDWQVDAITGEGDIRYHRSGTGPGFACGYNERQPCAWGATKAMKALAAVPPSGRTPAVERAIEVGVEFLLSRNLALADYPYTGKVASAWFAFGFPLSYRSDILETALVLEQLGYGSDPRLDDAHELIREKRDERGRWPMERSLNGKMWVDVEAKGQPSKWITLRALLALGSPRPQGSGVSVRAGN